MRRGVCVVRFGPVVAGASPNRASSPGLVLTIPPETIVEILKSAGTASPDPRLNQVLATFRRDWQALGRRRYPSLGDALDDALQVALLKVISPEKLAGLKDVGRVGAWARSIFIHAVMDVVRDL